MQSISIIYYEDENGIVFANSTIPFEPPFDAGADASIYAIPPHPNAILIVRVFCLRFRQFSSLLYAACRAPLFLRATPDLLRAHQQRVFFLHRINCSFLCVSHAPYRLPLSAVPVLWACFRFLRRRFRALLPLPPRTQRFNAPRSAVTSCQLPSPGCG